MVRIVCKKSVLETALVMACASTGLKEDVSAKKAMLVWVVS